jgi:antibiotic biosynthesis monooxygenase (ABM) superfamily enzyme
MRLYVFDAIMLKIFMDENPEIERENLPTWFTEKGEPKYNTRWEETISKI